MTSLFLALAMTLVSVSTLAMEDGATTESVTDFLPTSAPTEAIYVELERDPGFDDFAQRMQNARDRKPEWAAEYYRQHRTADRSPLPYHENFGVSREEYEHYTVPMNQFLEVERQEIRIHRRDRDGKVILELDGKDLLLDRLEIDPEANTVTTPTETLPYRGFVDLEQASLPPGVHRGVHYRTPDSRVRETHRRESLVIGEVADLEIGIFHFGLRGPEGNRRVYVRYPR